MLLVEAVCSGKSIQTPIISHDGARTGLFSELMLRVHDNPAARYPGNRPLEADLGRWAVAHVKSRQEKAFAFDLTDSGISYYLPMVENRIRRRDNGKIRKSFLPLFPGYVALALDREQWSGLYSTRRVANIIAVDDQERFVRELAQVQRALDSEVPVALEPAFALGRPVRVKSGAMQGLVGEVLSVRGQNVFVIRVHMFQQAVRVTLDVADLEAV